MLSADTARGLGGGGGGPDPSPPLVLSFGRHWKKKPAPKGTGQKLLSAERPGNMFP